MVVPIVQRPAVDIFWNLKGTELGMGKEMCSRSPFEWNELDATYPIDNVVSESQDAIDAEQTGIFPLQ